MTATCNSRFEFYSLKWTALLIGIFLMGTLQACGDATESGAKIKIIDVVNTIDGTDGGVDTDEGDDGPDTVTPGDTGSGVDCQTDLDCVLNYTNIGICDLPRCLPDSKTCTLLTKEGCCENDDGCDDGDPCTLDKCAFVGGICTHEGTTGDCVTNDDCQVDHPCYEGECAGACGVCLMTWTSGCCVEDSDCTTDELCSVASCDSGQCKVEKITEGCCSTDDECGDNNACTKDSCVASQCLNEAIDNCCTEDADCADDDPCTTESCEEGTCIIDVTGGECTVDSDCPTPPPVACAAVKCAECGVCEGYTIEGCCADDSACNDNDPCTTDACVNSQCESTPIASCCVGDPTVCDDSDPCTADVCTDDGTCASTAIEGCCTGDEQCNDGNDCTTDSCLLNQCVTVTNPECCTSDAQCADGNACTSDTCVNSQCLNEPISDCCTEDSQCDDGNFCTDTSCLLGQCVTVIQPDCCTNSTECDDGNACTLDTCVFGQCTHQGDPDCCKTDSECDDGDQCTSNKCENGKCLTQEIDLCCTIVSDCDDGDVCTTDSCFNNQCSHEQKESCCSTVADCDDNNPCTSETCLFGECIYTTLENCCKENIDCNDNNACTTDTCDNGACDYELAAGCCTDDAQCNDSDQCTADTCGTDGKCENTGIPNCCDPSSGVALAKLGFVPNVVDGIALNPFWGSYRWRENDANAFKGAASLYFGNNSATNYCSSQSFGGTPDGTATMPIESGPFPDGPTFIPEGVSAWATFHVWLDIRSSANVDQLTLSILSAGMESKQVWDKSTIAATQYKQWVPVTIDISEYAGKAIQLQFKFDVVDKNGDGGCLDAGAGPRIDEVAIVAANCSVGCAQDSECIDPPNGCYKPQGTCAAGECSYELSGSCCEKNADCDDGNVCTGDVCVVGACQHQTTLGCCTSDTQCDSGNECFNGSCNTSTNECSYDFTNADGCCITAADCDVGFGFCLTKATCEDSKCNVVPASQVKTHMFFSFTSEVDGWSTGQSGDYHWREIDTKYTSSALSLYFGNDDGSKYCQYPGSGGNQGPTPSGTAYLPGQIDPQNPNPKFPTGTISFDASGKTSLRFSVFADMRKSANVDKLVVRLRRADGVAFLMWSKVDLADEDYGKWINVDLDVTSIAPFEGRAEVVFEVGSPWQDGGCGNGGTGAYLDDIRVVQVCK